MAIIGTRNLANIVNYTLPDGSRGLDLKEGSHPLYQVFITR